MDQSAAMYVVYINILNKHFVHEVIPSIQSKQGDELLAQIVKAWHSFTIFACLLNRMFAYLERTYLKIAGKRPFGEECFSGFKTKIFLHLQEAIHSAIQMEI